MRVSSNSLVPPKQIGPYRVVRPLASGGMAAVYEVEDTQTRERLALKLLTQQGQAGPRFNREYRALTRLDHPNIVRVYRFGIGEDNSPYLTMELLDGAPAQVYAKSLGRPGTENRTKEVIRIVASVADALDYMHARGVIHRDLKSSNVLVLGGGEVKLLDFGTARIIGTHDQITRQGEFVGTFAYASPEQLTGSPVDARSDIYSLGVLFYRLLTGKRPFNADSPHALARLHLEHIPNRPDNIVAGIPADVAALVMRMLAKDAKDRPQSANALAAGLRSQHGSVERSDEDLLLVSGRLIGRDEQLRSLRATLGKARPGRMAIVSGQPGSGRSRLIRDVVASASEASWRVFSGTFPGAPGLGTIGEVTRMAARGLAALEGAGLGSGVEPDLAVLANVPGDEAPASGQRVRIVDAICSVFRRRAAVEEKPILLVLHDLHRAPPLAIQALRALRTMAVEEEAVIIVIASSTEEGDAPGTQLRRDFPSASRVPLEPLEPSEVGALVGAMLGRKAPPPSLAKRIHQATGGNPGYVEEIVRSMVQQGLVEPTRSRDDRVEWLDRSGGRVAIPGSVRDFIGLRVDGLSSERRRIVEALAVAGGEATVVVLAHAVDRPRSDVSSDLGKLANNHLVVRKAPHGQRTMEGSEEDVWKFRLGLTQQIVGERVRASRRYVLQRRLADALVSAPPSAEKIRLLVAAGRSLDTAGGGFGPYMKRAVRDVVQWSSVLLEDRRAEEVLPALRLVVPWVEAHAAKTSEGFQPPRGFSARLMAQLFLLHARALGLLEPGDKRADAALERADALVCTGKKSEDLFPHETDLFAEIRIEKARLYRRRGDVVKSQEILDQTRADLQAGASAPLRIKFHLDLGASHMFLGGVEKALKEYEIAQNVSAEVDDLRALGEARVGCGIARHALGQLVGAEEDLRAAGDVFGRVGDDAGRWHASLNLADVLRLQCRFSEALQLVEPAMQDARMSGRPYRYAGLLVNLAETQIELFRLGEARDILAELERLDITTHHPFMAAARSLLRGRLFVSANDSKLAIEVLSEGLNAAAAAELPVLSHQLRAYLGEALAKEGDLRRADTETRKAIDGLAQERHTPLLGEACACRVRALGEHEDPDMVFQPVLPWLNQEPVHLMRITYYIGAGDYARHRGASQRARGYYQQAEDTLREIRGLLAQSERSALQVHPWVNTIKRGKHLV